MDTGTPLPTITSPAYEALRQLLLRNCTRNPLVGICNERPNNTLFDGVCYKISQKEISKFPTLSYVISHKKQRLSINFSKIGLL